MDLKLGHWPVELGRTKVTPAVPQHSFTSRRGGTMTTLELYFCIKNEVTQSCDGRNTGTCQQQKQCESLSSTGMQLGQIKAAQGIAEPVSIAASAESHTGHSCSSCRVLPPHRATTNHMQLAISLVPSGIVHDVTCGPHCRGHLEYHKSP